MHTIINQFDNKIFRVEKFYLHDKRELPKFILDKYGDYADYSKFYVKTNSNKHENSSAAQPGYDNCVELIWYDADGMPVYGWMLCWNDVVDGGDGGGNGDNGGGGGWCFPPSGGTGSGTPPNLGGGGGGGGTGTPPGGGGNPTYNPCIPWYAGGENRCMPPANNEGDTAIIKKLKSDNEFVATERKRARDSAFLYDVEYGFYLGLQGTNKSVADWHISGLENQIFDNRRITRQYTLLGHWHTHQDSLPLQRHPHAPTDLLTNRDNISVLNFTTYVDCGDTLYAVVNENPILVKKFFTDHNLDTIQDEFDSYMGYAHLQR